MKATKAENNRKPQEESSVIFGEHFSANFRTLRAKAGLTLQDVADKLGAGVGTVQAWENGSIPRPSTLRKVSELFGYPVLALTSRNIGPIILSEVQPDAVEEPQSIYGVKAIERHRMTLNPAYASPPTAPTRPQIEARVKDYLDAAERVPGGLGYAWGQVATHLNPQSLDALKIEA
jgi:transcriptional regulator with XRE-family HTH domain